MLTQYNLNMYQVQVIHLLLQQLIKDTNFFATANDGTNPDIIEIQTGGDVVDDTSPQLGGDLDVNGNKIVSTSNGNIELEPNGTGDVILELIKLLLVAVRSRTNIF